MRTISWSSVHHLDGSLIIIGIDLTERKQLENEIRANESIKQMLETASQGIVLVNAQDEIVLVNQYIEVLFGIAREDLLAKHIEVLLSDSLDAIKARTDGTNAAQPINHEQEVTRADGSKALIEVSCTPVEIEGSTHSIVFLVDISERKQFEEQRIQVNQLQADIEKERLLQELQGRFVTLVSHEFRTPLAVINTSADIMLRYFDRLDETRIREKLQTVLRQVDRMVELMDDGLRQTTTNTRTPIFKAEALDMQTIVEETINAINTTNEKIYHIQVQVESGTIQADESLLKQIIFNLLINAIKYSPNETPVTLTAQNQTKYWVIKVHDLGIGIPEDDIQYIFEPFFRSNNVGSVSGTGLGLSIVKRYVEVHRGTITVDSTLHVGTTVTVMI